MKTELQLGGYTVDPLTRYVHVSYRMPAEVPAETLVRCEIQAGARAPWRPASVWPHVSDTALELMPTREWERGIRRGEIVERRAGGLSRTVVWNPFLGGNGNFTGRFRLTLLDAGGRRRRGQLAVRCDNRDVIVLTNWRNVVQRSCVSEKPKHAAGVWWFRRWSRDRLRLYGHSSLEVRDKGSELPQLTYPLNLCGQYAVFVLLPPKLGEIELRLSGDERTQLFQDHGQRLGYETFWRWADMTRQHLVIRQPYRTVYEYEKEFRAHLHAVRLVPLTGELVGTLERRWNGAGRRRLVVGYNEPYSWAFYEKVETALQHREPLAAFAEARVNMVDIQMGRGGARMVNETRVGDQLLGGTYGDPVRGRVPQTSNVGRMQQYTNMLATQLKYARELGLSAFANLGATNCYPGTPLESEFAKRHRAWQDREGCLKYGIPQVRAYLLALLEEALQIGAEGLSIDWCRYPYGVKSKQTVTGFFRRLRALADRYGKQRGKRVEILTRFPANGVRCSQFMDYLTWVKEGLVDFLCPSNIQARHLCFPIADYVAAVAGTKTKLLPCVDALSWGLPLPGPWLQRVRELYEAGADGVYIYQCDGAVLPSPVTRRYVALAGSVAGLHRWHEAECAQQSQYRKGIYLNRPHMLDKYHSWERLRVWCEGFQPTLLELVVDGKVINRYESPPYVLTSEECADDHTIRTGRHVLLVRAKDGGGWLEQEFKVHFA